MTTHKHSFLEEKCPDKDGGDFRCYSCGKLLAKTAVNGHLLEIKCSRCGNVVSLFQHIHDQIIVTDSEGVILYANQLVEEVTGYSLKEIIGKKPSLWGGQMEKSFYIDMWRRIKINKESVLVKVINKKKTGELYNALLRISPIVGASGEVVMFVGIESVV